MSQLAAGPAARVVLSVPRDPNRIGHDWLGTLGEVPLFEGLSKRHLRRIAKLARRGDEDGTIARRTQRGDVTAYEVDGGAPAELLPRERAVLAGGTQLVAEDGDRPLAGLVDVREGAALPSVRLTGVHRDAVRLELLAGAAAELVVGEGREEAARAREVGELDGRDRPAAGRLLPGLERVDDLARLRDASDPDELHPLHVPDDCEVHNSHLRPGVRFKE